MNTWRVFILLLGIALCGCKQKVQTPRTLEEAQFVFTNTSWYWSHCQWTPKAPPGFDLLDNHGLQAILYSTNNIKIIYNELQAERGLKSFRGLGTLESPSFLKLPLFQLRDDYTARNPDSVVIAGFLFGRMFWVEASGEDKAVALTNAYSIATNALEQLQRLQPK